MKAFIRQNLQFVLLLFGVIVLMDMSTSYLINKKADFKLPSNPKYIIVGHSHPECAFNDSLIDNFKNLANSGESYFYTYFKVKKILEQNNSIETIFIEYTNNQISQEMDNWTWDEKFITERYPIYSSFMSMSDQKILMEHNCKDYLNAFLLSGKSKLSFLFCKDHDYTKKLGGYLYLERDKTDSLLRDAERPDFIKDKISDKISITNLLYLNKTIALIKRQNKKIILVRSPQHPKYSGYENEATYKKILADNFSGIEYIDFSNYPLSNAGFGDLEHLNHKGAKVFSTWFNALMKRGLISSKNKQGLINQNLREQKS